MHLFRDEVPNLMTEGFLRKRNSKRSNRGAGGGNDCLRLLFQSDLKIASSQVVQDMVDKELMFLRRDRPPDVGEGGDDVVDLLSELKQLASRVVAIRIKHPNEGGWIVRDTIRADDVLGHEHHGHGVAADVHDLALHEREVMGERDVLIREDGSVVLTIVMISYRSRDPFSEQWMEFVGRTHSSSHEGHGGREANHARHERGVALGVAPTHTDLDDGLLQ